MRLPDAVARKATGSGSLAAPRHRILHSAPALRRCRWAIGDVRGGEFLGDDDVHRVLVRRCDKPARSVGCRGRALHRGVGELVDAPRTGGGARRFEPCREILRRARRRRQGVRTRRLPQFRPMQRNFRLRRWHRSIANPAQCGIPKRHATRPTIGGRGSRTAARPPRRAIRPPWRSSRNRRRCAIRRMA